MSSSNFFRKDSLYSHEKSAGAGMQIIIKNKFIMKLFSCIKFSHFVSTSQEISLALHKCLREWL